jgi:hypothetical protein
MPPARDSVACGCRIRADKRNGLRCQFFRYFLDDEEAHVVFGPHSALPAQVTLAGRGKKRGVSERSPAERHRAMTWAQRLKRVFRLD